MIPIHRATLGGGTFLAGAGLLLPASTPGTSPITFALIVPAILLLCLGMLLLGVSEPRHEV